MSDWDPALYRRFESERTRPASDLLARIPLDSPESVVDLGCGPGNSTELLATRYPGATITGLDSSPAMIAAARKRLPHIRFVEADLTTWQPDVAPDLVFANAVLQWTPDHATLLPWLVATLATGGVLAIQLPDNLAEPSHRLMREVACDGPWASALEGALTARSTLPPLPAYYDILCRAGTTVDLWRTTYQHPLASPAAIVEWVSSTGLRPFLEPLGAQDQAAFLSRYTAAIDEAYPIQGDGTRLLAFPRIFMVARRTR